MKNEDRKIKDGGQQAVKSRLGLAATRVRAYTLIEMMVVIAIALLVLAAVVSAVFLFYKTNAAALNQGYAVESARQGVQYAVRDIRSIQYGADGSYPINTIAPNSFIFYTDTNGDGITEKVHYFLSGTNFVRGVTFSEGIPPEYPSNGEVDTVISNDVQNALRSTPIFRYYDASSTELTTLSPEDPVAYVTIELIVNAHASPATSSDYTLRSTAALRNASQF